MNTQGEEVDKQIDEGFQDIDDCEDLNYTPAPDIEDHNTVACPVDESESDEEDETEVYVHVMYFSNHSIIYRIT